MAKLVGGEKLTYEERQILGFEMENQPSYIAVWPADAAPESLTRVANDDAAWFAYVPPIYAGKAIPWLEVPAFGAKLVTEHRQLNGAVVVIGYKS